MAFVVELDVGLRAPRCPSGSFNVGNNARSWGGRMKRYGALRFIAAVHKVVAGFLMIAAALFALAMVLRGTSVEGAGVYFIASIVAAVVMAILLWAAAESILVVIDIEENTRRAALASELLANLRK